METVHSAGAFPTEADGNIWRAPSKVWRLILKRLIK